MIVFEDELEQGKVTPMHLHADVDEALYVIDGEIVLSVEGDEHDGAAPVGFAFAPRGCGHAFVVTSRACPPAVHPDARVGQAFYRDASQPATTSGTGPVDFDRLR